MANTARPSHGGKKTPSGGNKNKTKPPRKRGWVSRFMRWFTWFAFRWSLVALVWIGIIGGLAVLYLAKDLPDVRGQVVLERRPTVTVLARDGSEIARYGDLHTGTVTVDELPDHLIEAVLAIEDRRFYWHPGIDPIGLIRAAVVNYQARRIVQGGSTLTQQLAKNLFLQPDRSLKRKAQEAVLALWLELSFTKDEILTAYLNRVYLGAGTYGVDAAARTYFDKPARALSLRESALIAGLLKAPSRFAPTNDPDRAWARARVVLAAMEDAGYITQETRQAAASGGAETRPGRGGAGRYFTDWILTQAAGYAGRGGRDLIVKTTLDVGMQRAAEQAVADALADGGRAGGARQAALIAMTPDGAVRAMVGGVDYTASQFNRAVDGQRQPGSAIKPLVYLAALEAGMAPGSAVEDAPITIAGWSPKNYAGRYLGRISLTEALASSANTAAVRVLRRTGLKRTKATLRKLGITAPLSNDLGLALGTSEVSPLELTAAYAVIANGGTAVWPHAIDEIRDGDGKVLFRYEDPRPQRVIAERNARAMQGMLRQVVESGTGSKAALDRPAAGKTGTTQSFRDAWFAGFTPQLVTTVWYGNDDNRPMNRIEEEPVTGGTLPAKTWAAFMTAAHQGYRVRDLPRGSLALTGGTARTVQAAPLSATASAPAAATGASSSGEDKDLDREGFAALLNRLSGENEASGAAAESRFGPAWGGR